MSDSQFPILGTEIPKLFGRNKIMNRLISDLTKKSPSHLSIVGPRYSGKSVIMKALFVEMSKEKSPYDTVILMDLGHQTPSDDLSFLKLLTKNLGSSLKSNHEEYAEYLLGVEDNYYDALREVIGELNKEDIKILMLWDGFDKPLAKGNITRNLWDQLRELASNSNFRLVTATRKKLHELIRSEDSATSDFWNIFDPTPVKVDKFDEHDKESILAAVSDLSLSAGAIKEIENWTESYPPLYLEFINQLIKLDLKTEISNDNINEIANSSIDIITSILSELWRDCSEASKNLYLHLIENNEVLLSEAGVDDKNSLFEKGFVTQEGNKIHKACRLLEKYAATLSGDISSMTRLFSENENYSDNIGSVLELRINQVKGIDEKIKKYIYRSIEDIRSCPEDSLTNVRNIIDRSLDLIWLAELGEKREIPSEWFKYWEFRGEKGLEYWHKKFPSKRGHEIRLLHLITGTQNSVAKAKHVSKNTFALASALHGFGDFGQHLDGASVPIGVAVSSIMMSIELASLLTSELNIKENKV